MCVNLAVVYAHKSLLTNELSTIMRKYFAPKNSFNTYLANHELVDTNGTQRGNSCQFVHFVMSNFVYKYCLDW